MFLRLNSLTDILVVRMLIVGLWGFSKASHHGVQVFKITSN